MSLKSTKYYEEYAADIDRLCADMADSGASSEDITKAVHEFVENKRAASESRQTPHMKAKIDRALQIIFVVGVLYGFTCFYQEFKSMKISVSIFVVVWALWSAYMYNEKYHQKRHEASTLTLEFSKVTDDFANEFETFAEENHIDKEWFAKQAIRHKMYEKKTG